MYLIIYVIDFHKTYMILIWSDNFIYIYSKTFWSKWLWWIWMHDFYYTYVAIRIDLFLRQWWCITAFVATRSIPVSTGKSLFGSDSGLHHEWHDESCGWIRDTVDRLCFGWYRCGQWRALLHGLSVWLDRLRGKANAEADYCWYWCDATHGTRRDVGTYGCWLARIWTRTPLNP